MGSRPILGKIGRAKFQFYIFHKYKINQRGLKSKFEDLREIHQIRYFAKMGGSGVGGVVTFNYFLKPFVVHFCHLPP